MNFVLALIVLAIVLALVGWHGLATMLAVAFFVFALLLCLVPR